MWTEWPYALPGEDPEEMTFAVALSLLRVQERREGGGCGYASDGQSDRQLSPVRAVERGRIFRAAQGGGRGGSVGPPPTGWIT